MKRLQAAFEGRDVPPTHVAGLAKTLHVFAAQLQPWFDGQARLRSRPPKSAKTGRAPPPPLREVFVACLSCKTLRFVAEKTAKSANFTCARVVDARYNVCSKAAETDAVGTAAFRAALEAKRDAATRLPPNVALSALRRNLPRAYALPSLPAIESLLNQVRSTRLSRAKHPVVPVGVEAVVSAPPPSKPKGRGRAASGGAPFVWNEGGVDTVVAFTGTLGVFDNHTNGTAVLAAMKNADDAIKATAGACARCGCTSVRKSLQTPNMESLSRRFPKAYQAVHLLIPHAICWHADIPVPRTRPWFLCQIHAASSSASSSSSSSPAASSPLPAAEASFSCCWCPALQQLSLSSSRHTHHQTHLQLCHRDRTRVYELTGGWTKK